MTITARALRRLDYGLRSIRSASPDTKRAALTIHADRTLKSQEALHAACCRLCQLGYTPLLSGPDAQCPYDIRADRPGTTESLRIQVKYSADGRIDPSSASCRRASAKDFDYYALYLAPLEIIVLVHRRFAGRTIRYTLPNAASPFYWIEDFMKGFTDSAPQRRLPDFGVSVRNTRRGIPNPKARKGRYPTVDMLQKRLMTTSVLALSKEIGVSDNALRKHCKRQGIRLPSLGAWVHPTARGLARRPYERKKANPHHSRRDLASVVSHQRSAGRLPSAGATRRVRKPKT